MLFDPAFDHAGLPRISKYGSLRTASMVLFSRFSVTFRIYLFRADGKGQRPCTGNNRRAFFVPEAEVPFSMFPY